jgi:Holliday junction resolvase
MPINSRRKGAAAERAWRDVLRAAGYEARRGRQYAGHPDAPDVVGGPLGWHAEVKCREQHNVWDWMDEAEVDAGPEQNPYVAIKRNGRRWLVVLRDTDFLDLAKLAQECLERRLAEEVAKVEAKATTPS